MPLRELFKHWTYQAFAPGTLLRNKYNAFKELLRRDDLCLNAIAALEDIYYGHEKSDWSRVVLLVEELMEGVRAMAGQLTAMSPMRYMDLMDYYNKIGFYARMSVSVEDPEIAPPYVFSLKDSLDRPGQAGGKAVNLARIAAETDMAVPSASVVSASVYHYFIEANELREPLDLRLREIRLSDPSGLVQLAQEMQAIIHEAEIPEQIADQIEIAALETGKGGRPLAVRSSAVAEDGDSSFAGQYESVLNVGTGEILEAWKEVVASKYSPRALSYRIMRGLADQETGMAVIIMPMVEPRCAGVCYSMDAQDHESVGIYALKGLGDKLVDGSENAFAYLLSRQPGHKLVQKPPKSVLSTKAARIIARLAMRLEQLFGAPQDVEWVQDERGGVHIVQSRPVTDMANGIDLPRADTSGMEVLLDNLEPVSEGIAAGTVRKILNCREIKDLDSEAVLATRTLGPALTRVVDKLTAVVAASGSRASHFASVAREFGLPVVTGAYELFASLEDGQEVTVDAYSGKVFKGLAKNGPDYCVLDSKSFGTAKRLGKAMDHISRLTLTDPASENFAPKHCKSLHDLVRFCHEKGVAEMFTLVSRSGRGLTGAKKLKSRLPIVMYVLNIEDGLFASAAGKKEITPEDIKSVPMWALWFGLSSEKIKWDQNLTHMDWDEFDRTSAGIFAKDSMHLASYCVLSKNYMHLMVRFGYHFSVVDTYCGEGPNYINFRFKGGGGLADQRRLRLKFIDKVLSANNFNVTRTGDMLDAKHPHAEESTIQKRLATLGLLLAKTRMMDMGLDPDADTGAMADEFMAEHEDE